ncbi:MAG: CoB--CoM heterodisulfide reductase iron-sulfur subunit B family protein [Anaerolineae bacterium]
MRYLYYPGCSLKSTAQEYDMSTQAVLGELGVELVELDDWTCCGASAAETASELLSFVLPARNLALAEQAGDGQQLVASCSACYVNLQKVNAHIEQDPQLLDRINQALSVDGLEYTGTIHVRHLLDVISNDIGPEAIAAQAQRSLEGLRVAPYYGCQTVRPYSPFDAPYLPDSMDRILLALHATIHPNTMKAVCCGGTLLTTKREVGLKLVTDLVEAVDGADCIVTVCPLCQMNLESYQGLIAKKVGHPVRMPVIYLPQLLGLAFGLTKEQLGLKHNVVPIETLPALQAEEV